MLRSFVGCHEDGLMLLVPGKSSVGFSGSVGICRILHICASQNMSFVLATFSSLVFAHQAPLH